MSIFSCFTDLLLACAAAKKKNSKCDLKFILGMVVLSGA